MSQRRSYLINTFVFAALPTVLRVPEPHYLLFDRVCVCVVFVDGIPPARPRTWQRKTWVERDVSLLQAVEK